MTQQQLKDIINSFVGYGEQKIYDAIEEIYKENEQLNLEIEELRELNQELRGEIETHDNLEAINAELLEALKEIAKMDNKDFANSFHPAGKAAEQIQFIGKMAKAAIAKAEGKV